MSVEVISLKLEVFLLSKDAQEAWIILMWLLWVRIHMEDLTDSSKQDLTTMTMMTMIGEHEDHGPWWRPSTTLPTSSTAGHRTRRHGSRAPRRRTHSFVRAPAISLVTEPVNIGSGPLHRLTHSFVRAVANPRLIRNICHSHQLSTTTTNSQFHTSCQRQPLTHSFT